MRSLARRLLALATAASLLLGAAWCALWVRSHWVRDVVRDVHVRRVPLRLGPGFPVLGYGTEAVDVVHDRGRLVVCRSPRSWAVPGKRPWHDAEPVPAATDPYLDGVECTAVLQGREQRLLGFRRSEYYGFTFLSVPDYAVALACGLLPAARAAAALRRRRRGGRGLCPHCGYDLRASPVRCPECGAARRDSDPGTATA
jgi:hypothetical protein